MFTPGSRRLGPLGICVDLRWRHLGLGAEEARWAVELIHRALAERKNFRDCGAELMTVTAKQLRLKTSEVLKSVARGGSVTVTLRGKPVAKLVSLEETKERKLTDFAAFGMWAGRKDMEDPVAWVRRIRKPRYRLH